MTKIVEAHTQYAQYEKVRKLAVEKIVNNRRFLFTDDNLTKDELQQRILQDINPYLVEVNPAESPLQHQIDALKNNTQVEGKAEREQKIADKQALLTKYTNEYNQAIVDYPRITGDMKALVDANNAFLAPEEKQNEYLHIIDQTTCKYLCIEENKAETCSQTFEGRQRTIELKGMQTDAVRVWCDNITLDKLIIRDNRVDDKTAHRDGIQLIPPPAYRKVTDNEGNVTLFKEADQMAGTILSNTTIKNCDILAPKAALQGIFSSDGMCKNLKIHNVTVGTKGGHAISIAGALTGCEISNVSLYQQTDGPMPEIALYPVRIGGNMADDGMIYILHFKNDTGYKYDTVINQNNKVYKAGDNQASTLEITDNREKLPQKFLKIAFGLRDFDYQKYYDEYTNWTVAEFKQKMPEQYRQMEAWISRRLTEYSSGKRTVEIIDGLEVVLPAVSEEQQNPKEFGVRDMLQKAQKALHDKKSDWMNTRLPELQETAIRSFSMKCIAFENGRLVDLYDLGENDNALRKAYLHYLLKDSDFANLVKNPYAKKKDESNKPIDPITPKDTWSRNAKLKEHLRMTQQTVSQGEPIKLFFSEGSPFDESYTFFWKVTAKPDVFSNTNSFTIDTNKLDIEDRQRIQIQISKSGEETITGSAYINVKEAIAKEPEPVIPDDTWSHNTDLKTYLRMSQQTVKQGEPIKLFFKEGAPFDNTYSYYWKVTSKPDVFSNTDSFTIDTSKLDIGDKQRIQIQISKAGEETVTGSAYINIKEKQATDGSTETTESSEIPIIPNAEFETQKPTIIKDKETIIVGDKVTFSLDADYEDARYYWVFDGNGADAQKSSGSKLAVKTTGLNLGSYRVRGTVTSKDRKQHQVSMIFEIKSNWIGIEVEAEGDFAQYQGTKYEFILPDGTKITGALEDKQIFHIDVPEEVEEADFRWVD